MWMTALVLVVGAYYILELILEHREKMVRLNQRDEE